MQSLSQTLPLQRAGGSRAISPASVILVLDRFHIVAMSVERLFVGEPMIPMRIDVVDLDQVSIPEVQSTPCAFPSLPNQE
jgi:hypothetical protein